MGKFDYAKLTVRERHKVIDPLVEALTYLKQPKLMREFISRLLTPSELIMIARRFQIAERLVVGKSYYTIREELGVGFSTIRSVDSWLEHTVRDYHEVRAQERREAEDRLHHQRRLAYRPTRRDPRKFLIDLFIEAIISL